MFQSKKKPKMNRDLQYHLDVAVNTARANVENQARRLEVVRISCSLTIREIEMNLHSAKAALEALEAYRRLLEGLPSSPPPTYEETMGYPPRVEEEAGNPFDPPREVGPSRLRNRPRNPFETQEASEPLIDIAGGEMPSGDDDPFEVDQQRPSFFGEHRQTARRHSFFRQASHFVRRLSLRPSILPLTLANPSPQQIDLGELQNDGKSYIKFLHSIAT
jgi:hypothetical protein